MLHKKSLPCNFRPAFTLLSSPTGMRGADRPGRCLLQLRDHKECGDLRFAAPEAVLRVREGFQWVPDFEPEETDHTCADERPDYSVAIHRKCTVYNFQLRGRELEPQKVPLATVVERLEEVVKF